MKFLPFIVAAALSFLHQSYAETTTGNNNPAAPLKSFFSAEEKAALAPKAAPARAALATSTPAPKIKRAEPVAKAMPTPAPTPKIAKIVKVEAPPKPNPAAKITASTSDPKKDLAYLDTKSKQARLPLPPLNKIADDQITEQEAKDFPVPDEIIKNITENKELPKSKYISGSRIEKDPMAVSRMWAANNARLMYGQFKLMIKSETVEDSDGKSPEQIQDEIVVKQEEDRKLVRTMFSSTENISQVKLELAKSMAIVMWADPAARALIKVRKKKDGSYVWTKDAFLTLEDLAGIAAAELHKIIEKEDI